jgi:hypothetical protein
VLSGWVFRIESASGKGTVIHISWFDLNVLSRQIILPRRGMNLDYISRQG